MKELNEQQTGAMEFLDNHIKHLINLQSDSHNANRGVVILRLCRVFSLLTGSAISTNKIELHQFIIYTESASIQIEWADGSTYLRAHWVVIKESLEKLLNEIN